MVPALLALAALPAHGQQPTGTQPPPPAPPVLAVPAVGDMAPDFSIRGATRYGVLANRPRLSDYKGQTVVLAFFIQARTRG
jgi:hypothetical protein